MGRQPSGRVSSEATRRVASTVAFRTRAGIEATADNAASDVERRTSLRVLRRVKEALVLRRFRVPASASG